MFLRSIAVSVLGLASILPVTAIGMEPAPVQSAVYHPGVNNRPAITTVAVQRRRRQRHPARKTVKRVGIGAGGGAAIGALAGGGKGAGIGALAGAGAGALYDHHEKKKGN